MVSRGAVTENRGPAMNAADPPTRIAFCHMPPDRLLREIVEEVVASEPGLELVGDASGDGNLARVADSGTADFLITGVDELDDGDLDAALAARPAVRVLALAGDGSGGFLYERDREPVALDEASPDRLREAFSSQDRPVPEAVAAAEDGA